MKKLTLMAILALFVSSVFAEKEVTDSSSSDGHGHGQTETTCRAGADSSRKVKEITNQSQDSLTREASSEVISN